MPTNSNNTSIFNVEVQATEALKTLAELRLRAQELRQAQKDLGPLTEENAVEYTRLGQQLNAVNAQARKYQTQISNNIKIQQQTQGSLNQMRTQLSLLTQEYADLGTSMDEIARKSELQVQIKNLSDAIKEQENALGDHRRSVGDYTIASQDLKEETINLGDTLRQLTEQLENMAAAGDTSSETYRNLIKQAGELKAAQDRVGESIDQVGRGLQTFQTINDSLTVLTSTYSLVTAGAQALGLSTDSLEETMQKLAVATSALVALQQIQAVTARNTATYQGALNIVQLVGINQTKAAATATAAWTAMTNASTVSQKLAAAATWLWNAALSANPVVLVTVAIAGLVAGVTVLVKWFKNSSEAARENAAAQENLERVTNNVTRALQNQADAFSIQTNRLKKDQEDRIRSMMGAGATEQELNAQRIKDSNEVLKIENANSNRQIDLWNEQRTALERSITAQRNLRNEYDQDSKKWKEANDKLNELIEQYNGLGVSITNARLSISQNLTGIVKNIQDAQKQTTDAIKQANQEISQALTERSNNAQKLAEAQYQLENTYRSDSLAARQKYESDMYNIAYNGELERLNIARRYGQITREEYNSQYQLLQTEYQQFYANQLKDVNEYNANMVETLTKQAMGDSVKAQLDEVDAEYRQAIEKLNNVEAPTLVPGMSMDEFSEALNAYENFVAQKAQLEEQFENQRTQKRKEIQDKANQEEVDAYIKALRDGDAQRLLDLQNNAQERLKIEQSEIEQEIAMRQSKGMDTNEQELELQQNLTQQKAIQYQIDLNNAEKNAKQIRDVKLAYINQQLQDEKLGELERQELQKQSVEANQEYLNSLKDTISKYGEYAQEMLSSVFSLFDAIDESRKQKIEEEYEQESDNLQTQLDNGLITQEQYDKKQQALDEKKDKEEAKLERQKAIRDRIATIFSIAMSTAEGIMSALATFWISDGMPWVAIISAMGALQMAAALAQPLPSAGKGKLLEGPSHSNGGILLEAEGGEAIINKRSTKQFLPLLSAINEAGGGIPFVKPYADGGYVTQTYLSSGGVDNSMIQSAIQRGMQNVKIVATIEDIRRENANYVEIENRGRVN